MPGAYLLQADARAIPLADGSVQCVVTSPPYWGLRDYGLPPSVWGGEPGHAHEWTRLKPPTLPNSGGTRSAKQSSNTGSYGHYGEDVAGAFCPCGAWRGVLGLEPTPELYVAHMVEVFREVRRVLRDEPAEFYCHGCRQYICDQHQGDTPMGGHKPEDHDDEGARRAKP